MKMKNFVFCDRLIIAWLIFTLHLRTSLPIPIKNDICDTPECYRIAQNFRESIDLAQDPCDNFYQFVCGNWPKHHPNMNPSTANSTITIRSDNNYKKLLEFMKQSITETDPNAVQKLKKLFSQCADTNIATFYKKGAEIVDNILHQCNLPRTPPLFSNPLFNLPTTLAKIYRTVGLNAHFTLVPDMNPDNKTENILTLTIPQPSTLDFIPFSETRNQPSFENLLKSQNGILKEICFNSENCEALIRAINDEEIQEQDDYRDDLIETSSVLEEENAVVRVSTLRQLQNLTDILAAERRKTVPTFNWTQYIGALYDGIEDVSLDLSKPSDIKIAIPSTRDSEHIIKSLHKRSLKAYEILSWSFVAQRIAIYSDYKTAKLLKNPFVLADNTTSRDHLCMAIFSDLFPHGMSYYYQTNPQHTEIKNEVKEMVVNIKQILKNLLEGTPWMDADTKKKSIEKLKALKQHIAYPDLVELSDFLEEFYGSLEVGESFLESMVKTEQNNVKKKLSLLIALNDLKKDRRAQSIHVPPTIVNAFYSPERNTIIIPAGILGPPIYEHSLGALVYGSMGTIVGHEITHGFDNKGSQYNATGDLEDWWNPNTLEEYKKRARCFTHAYANYSETIQNITIKGNSNLTLGEDIADNDGFKEALFAYREYILQNGPEPLLPGFENYTHEQIFTLSFANLYCENPTPEYADRFARTSHSPSGVRVNGVLRNSDEFSKIWNCPRGSNMNPNVEKCVMF